MAIATFELGNVQVDKLTEPSGGPTSSFGDTITAPALDAQASSALLIGTINATGMTIGHTGITVNHNAATSNFSGNVNLTTFTSGSVVFTDGSGLVSQSNSTFFWDDTNKRLGIGTTTPGFTGGVADVPGTRLHLVNATSHSLLVIESDAASSDAGLLIATAANGFDAAIWMDETDSQKLKISLSNGVGGENNHSDRTGTVRMTITQPGSIGIGTTGPVSKFDVNGNVSIGTYAGSNAAPTNGLIVSGLVGIGTSSPASTYAMTVQGPSGGEGIKLTNTSTNSHADICAFDSSGVQKNGFGYANSAVGNSFASLNFFYTPGVDWVMSDATTNFFRWYTGSSAIGFEMSNGSSATVSGSNKGKIRYNSSTQHFEISENGGAYKGIAAALASANDFQLTTTSPTTIVAYTPPTQGNYKVDIYYRVVTATTNVTITLTWTDGSGAQTSSIVPLTSLAVGSYLVTPTYINSTAAAITLSATSGTANNLYVSASIGGA